jgi:hypothetical protein
MHPLRSVILFVFSLSLAGGAGAAVPSKIVVRNSSQLQSAFISVPAGGVIELAAGTYAAPGSGFSISKPKAFTVRAAEGVEVFLDGQGVRPILRIKNNSKGVTFQRITFRNGSSKTEGDSGAVTLNASAARFERCNFLNNTATGKTTGGGAVGLTAASTATFVRNNFRNNSSGNRGGAISVISSVLNIQGGEFTDNRTNLPGHKPTSIGGGIYALNSTVQVSDATFLRNEAGWVGGAIEAFGNWTNPVTTPRSLIVVTRSTFMNNRAVPDHPCCGQIPITAGGAIHVEDQTTLRVSASHFIDNSADHGGALDSYRALIEVSGSILLGNRTPLVAGKLGVGGAIAVASNDSSVDGANNRRPGGLTITDSLLQGGVAPPGAPAHTGGCVAVEGDWSRIYGVGVAPSGSLADNRSPVTLRRTAFVDCDIQKSAAGGGLGGGVTVTMADLVMDNSIVFDSDARGTDAGGGAVAVQRESAAVISNSTFAHNTAEKWGGALFLNGSTVQVMGCRFLRNEVSPGVSEPVGESRGAAIFSIPQIGAQFGKRDVGGLVSGSVFSENAGIPVWDVEPGNGAPFNEMRYESNQFYSVTFGDRIYANTVDAKTGVNTSVLDSLTVFHAGRPPLDKGNGNSRLFSAPSVGALLASPPSLGTGFPATNQSFLAYAWSGRSAALDGLPLGSSAGLTPVLTTGPHTLTVDGNAVATVQVAATPARR